MCGRVRSNYSEGDRASSFLWEGLGFSLGKESFVMLKTQWSSYIGNRVSQEHNGQI